MFRGALIAFHIDKEETSMKIEGYVERMVAEPRLAAEP